MVVLDASAVLAAIFDEAGADRVVPHLAPDAAVLNAVNLAEIAGKLVDCGFSDADATITLGALKLLVSPLTADTAVAAGLMRRKTRQNGLSLGDRACLAEAQMRGLRVLTADRAWADLELDIDIEVIR
jgi:PIN domain nuclease of toxin-antitoxin system